MEEKKTKTAKTVKTRVAKDAKSTVEKQQKLTYDQLNDACSQLFQQNQQLLKTSLFG